MARNYESRCPATTAAGKPCEGYVHPGKTYCPAHDPAREEARKKAAAKAGRYRAHPEFVEVKQQLRQLADDVLSGAVNRADASVVSQILGTWAKVAEALIRLRQFEEIDLPEFKDVVGRLEQLEAQAEQRQRERGGWAA